MIGTWMRRSSEIFENSMKNGGFTPLFCYVRKMEKEGSDKEANVNRDLRPSVEGRDYYWEDGKMVLSEFFLKARGYCCESGCRHCPYGFLPKKF